MKNQHVLLTFLILIVFAFFATGCGSKSGPEEVYWQYWDACTEGKFSEAEKYISETARETARILGNCAFSHDAINTVEATNGNPPRTFSEDPEVTIQDAFSSLTWFDDQGNIATVTLVKTDDSWKIVEAFWSR
jgi:hypothetical protein